MLSSQFLYLYDTQNPPITSNLGDPHVNDATTKKFVVWWVGKPKEHMPFTCESTRLLVIGGFCVSYR